eukprot:3354019-Pyramimonas_sp.AAC.1
MGASLRLEAPHTLPLTPTYLSKSHVQSHTGPPWRRRPPQVGPLLFRGQARRVGRTRRRDRRTHASHQQ